MPICSRYLIPQTGEIMINTPDIERPPKQLIETLSSISSATAAGELCRLGIRDPQILGPVPRTPGKTVVGTALTPAIYA